LHPLNQFLMILKLLSFCKLQLVLKYSELHQI
jgi:hypothetical protein